MFLIILAFIIVIPFKWDSAQKLHIHAHVAPGYAHLHIIQKQWWEPKASIHILTDNFTHNDFH